MTDKQTRAEALREGLPHFTGTQKLFRHAFFRAAVYTEGVQFLAEKGECYWLLDDIVSHLASPAFNRAAAKDDRIRDMHFWKLKVAKDESAKLTARADDGVKPFVSQDIPYTDFPLDEQDVWAQRNEFGSFTLMLPGEY